MSETRIGDKSLKWKGMNFDTRLQSCEVKGRKWGRYSRIRFETNATHAAAWDKLINGEDLKKEKGESDKNFKARQKALSETRKRILSFIPGVFWGYKAKGTDRSGPAWERVLGRDKFAGRLESTISYTVDDSGCSGCGCGGEDKVVKKVYKAIAGQLGAFANVIADTKVLEGLRLYFTLQAADTSKQFQAQEMVVANNDPKMLAALKEIAKAEDIDKLNAQIEKVSGMAYKYGKEDGIRAEEGLADSAALLAASALREVAKLKKCDSSGKAEHDDKKKIFVTVMRGGKETTVERTAIEAWTERAQLWLKIARRLAHPADALRYEKTIPMVDPLFAGGVSSFDCIDSIMQGAMVFSASGDGITISGPVKAFLLSSYEAAFGCKKGIVCKDGKIWVVPRNKCEAKKSCNLKLYDYDREYNRCVRKLPPCPKNQIRINGKCKCPRGLQWIRNWCRRIGDPPVCKGENNEVRRKGKCVCKRGYIKRIVRGKKVCRPKICTHGRKPNGDCKSKPVMRPVMTSNMAAEGMLKGMFFD